MVFSTAQFSAKWSLHLLFGFDNLPSTWRNSSIANFLRKWVVWLQQTHFLYKNIHGFPMLRIEKEHHIIYNDIPYFRGVTTTTEREGAASSSPYPSTSESSIYSLDFVSVSWANIQTAWSNLRSASMVISVRFASLGSCTNGGGGDLSISFPGIQSAQQNI